MLLYAITHKALPEDTEIVLKLLSFLELDKTRLFNIPNHRPDDLVTSNSVVLTFGKFAGAEVASLLESKPFTNVRHEKLPHPKFLINKVENKETRLAVLEKLKEVKEILSTNIFQPDVKKISQKDLPDASQKELLILQRFAEENKQNSFFQVNKNGKLIEIGNGSKKSPVSDLFISIEEIYTIRSIMDVLKVDEVELVTTKTQDKG